MSVTLPPTLSSPSPSTPPPFTLLHFIPHSWSWLTYLLAKPPITSCKITSSSINPQISLIPAHLSALTPTEYYILLIYFTFPQSRKAEMCERSYWYTEHRILTCCWTEATLCYSTSAFGKNSRFYNQCGAARHIWGSKSRYHILLN